MSKTYYGIDLSKHNIVTSWAQVYEENQIDFVILRAGGNFGGYYKDSRFEQYYNACKMYGIPVGAYYDAGKTFFSADYGRDYAKHFCDLLSGKQFEMPVYVDIEVTPAKYKKYITEAAISFCELMESRRYFVGIYGSDISTFYNLLDIDQVQRYSKWVARYGLKPNYVKNYNMWQYSSTGTVKGIKGKVDLDRTTTNFPKIVKGGCFNGY